MARNITDPVAITVTSAATALCAAYSSRSAVTVYNNSATVTIYIGNSDVTDATGMPIPPKMERPVATEGILYGITASSSAEARVCEERF